MEYIETLYTLKETIEQSTIAQTYYQASEKYDNDVQLHILIGQFDALKEQIEYAQMANENYENVKEMMQQLTHLKQQIHQQRTYQEMKKAEKAYNTLRVEVAQKLFLKVSPEIEVETLFSMKKGGCQCGS